MLLAIFETGSLAALHAAVADLDDDNDDVVDDGSPDDMTQEVDDVLQTDERGDDWRLVIQLPLFAILFCCLIDCIYLSHSFPCCSFL